MELDKKNAKIVIKLAGDSSVGKTSIITSYFNNTFSENIQATIGVDFKNCYIMIKEEKVKLCVWDTAGQDKFRTMTTSYYRNTDALCLVFSFDDRKSFENLDKWVREYKEYRNNEPKLMLVGNKDDSDNKVVTDEEAINYAHKNYMIYTKVSAKTNKGIKDLFTEIGHQVWEEKKKTITNEGNKGIQLHMPSVREFLSHRCC